MVKRLVGSLIVQKENYTVGRMAALRVESKIYCPAELKEDSKDIG